MASSRKRKRDPSHRVTAGKPPAVKKLKESPPFQSRTEPPRVKHAVLNQYFAKVLTLRNYVLQVLPPSSRIRRKKIASIGTGDFTDAGIPNVELCVGTLLDTTLVGLLEQPMHTSDNRWEQWTNFTQKGDESIVTLSDGLAGASYSQSEIVDFVIWQLFSRSRSTKDRPEHVLCEGYRKDYNAARLQSLRGVQPSNNVIPGIFALHSNPQVQALKQEPWPQILKLLGKCGDRIMIDLLLDCGVFASLKAGHANYRQISGKPLSKAKLLLTGDQLRDVENLAKAPSEILFVRNRMMYARAALNSHGLVHFGFRHIHVLNRSPYTQPVAQLGADASSNGQHKAKNCTNTCRVLMYMFPRQFGLHNVFTSKVDHKETAQRLKDYTLREDEIVKKFENFGKAGQTPRLPKRLNGDVKVLVQKLQILHSRCACLKLLEHYCPISEPSELNSSSQSSRNITTKTMQNSVSRVIQAARTGQPASVPSKAIPASSIVELATPVAHVSAFCQAVISRTIPDEFFGSDDVLRHNRRLLRRKVDQFIRLRRFEGLSLHEVMQGMKISEIKWLAPPKLMDCKTSQTDIRKRSELFYEFLYYVFDSILIPLLRGNFYVTESNTDKYQLFFFRHDVWRYVAEPAMATLKTKMFEEVNMNDACRILASRQLGFSQVRLLPKGLTVRPIMNLRKKMLKSGGAKELGASINTLLKPAHTVLRLEKSLNPVKMGSSMSSVGDIYQRVKTFKSRLGPRLGQLYFAKVDVQSAFDTIPQSAIVGLLDSIPQRRDYQIAKHVEITNSSFNDFPGQQLIGKSRKPMQKWLSTATKHDHSSSLLESIEIDRAPKKKNTVFIEDVFKWGYDTSSMLQLVASHIQQNLVKIGKKYYRQKQGIPQGSVLSSTLCNYFYADLEIQVLAFLDSDDCLLLRLIDDFLLVTSDKIKASRFVEIMHAGIPEYGVTVNPAKTLVNFDHTMDGVSTNKLSSTISFPYCGTLISTNTLNITKDRSNRSLPTTSASNISVFNSLTVEYTRVPGQTFQRKALNAFKIQSHLMYFDTSLNSPQTMLSNLYGAFLETATKTWAYARCLPQPKQPAPALVIRTIQKLAEVAFLLMTSKARKARYPGYLCDVRKMEVTWLAYSAFLNVLTRRQSNYRCVLEWLKGEIRTLSAMKDIRKGRVCHITQDIA